MTVKAVVSFAVCAVFFLHHSFVHILIWYFSHTPSSFLIHSIPAAQLHVVVVVVAVASAHFIRQFPICICVQQTIIIAAIYFKYKSSYKYSNWRHIPDEIGASALCISIMMNVITIHCFVNRVTAPLQLGFFFVFCCWFEFCFVSFLFVAGVVVAIS